MLSGEIPMQQQSKYYAVYIWLNIRALMILWAIAAMIAVTVSAHLAYATVAINNSAKQWFSYPSDNKVEIKLINKQVFKYGEQQSILFHSAELNREVPAFLIMPKGKGPFAAIIYLHMYPGDNEQFIEEAKSLAQNGVVSLLIYGLFPWRIGPEDLETDRKIINQQIIELRRAIDLLVSLKQVDAKRIGFVGMDYGGMHGCVLAGVDNRIKTYVIIAATTEYIKWNSIINFDVMNKEYAQGMNLFDPIVRIRDATAPILFQFGTEDAFISKKDGQALYAAAVLEKKIKWYDAGHESVHKAGAADRNQWLCKQLSFSCE